MSEKKTQIRVFSYNIHKGFAFGNLRFTLARIKQAIEALSADIVFLQEVQGRHEGKARQHREWPEKSQFEFLADQLWPHYAYGQNSIYTEGHHGNAILSKFPIEKWDNYDVSTNRFERRGILHAQVRIPATGKAIDCLTLHFNMLRAGREYQIRELCRIIQDDLKCRDGLIVAGDFNDWSETATRSLNRHLHMEEVFFKLTGRHARTYPSRLPVLRLDRIYFRNMTVLGAKVFRDSAWQGLSDHLGLSADFEF